MAPPDFGRARKKRDRRGQNNCSLCSRTADGSIVRRLRWSNRQRNCAIESTWSKCLDIGKLATSPSKVSSHGALADR